MTTINSLLIHSSRINSYNLKQTHLQRLPHVSDLHNADIVWRSYCVHMPHARSMVCSYVCGYVHTL